MSVREQQKQQQRTLLSKHFALNCYFSTVLPARFSDDHLCSYFMEGFPEFRVLQSHPDVALEIGIRASSHGGGRRAAEVGLQV